MKVRNSSIGWIKIIEHNETSNTTFIEILKHRYMPYAIVHDLNFKNGTWVRGIYYRYFEIAVNDFNVIKENNYVR